MRALPSVPRRLRRPALAAALAAGAIPLLAAACGDSTGTGTGSFSADVTGATNLSYSGDALGLREGGYGYALVMESAVDLGPQQFSMFLYRSDASAPALGDHQVVESPEPDEFEGSIVLALGEPSELLCVVTQGTLTFTSSSSRRAAGSFDLSVTCTLVEDPEAEPTTATVTGTFDAVMATAI